MFTAQPITATTAAEALTAPARPVPATPSSYDAADPYSRRVQPAQAPAQAPDEESLDWTPFEVYLPAEEQERRAAARQAAETPAAAPSAPQTDAEAPAAPEGQEPAQKPLTAAELRSMAATLSAWAARLDAATHTATE